MANFLSLDALSLKPDLLKKGDTQVTVSFDGKNLAEGQTEFVLRLDPENEIVFLINDFGQEVKEIRLTMPMTNRWKKYSFKANFRSLVTPNQPKSAAVQLEGTNALGWNSRINDRIMYH